MGFLDFITRLFGKSDLPPAHVGMGMGELVQRLNVRFDELDATEIRYHSFTVPKRRGGTRTINAPAAPLKAMQRRILHRLLRRLHAHPAAIGFERKQSIVDHACLHAFKPVVVKMDLRDFFGSTAATRVHAYFRHIGWDDEAAKALTRLTTYQGKLPQGAPTSPRLSNLVNYRMDARISALVSGDRETIYINPQTGEKINVPPRGTAFYSRYADDITISFANDNHYVNQIIHSVKRIVADEGYQLHTKKKLRIMREHDRQQVTGLVVNKGVRLPRATRRRLRAVEHHLATGRDATLSHAQLTGWHALQKMIDEQRIKIGARRRR